jgi:hypothetical protein
LNIAIFCQLFYIHRNPGLNLAGSIKMPPTQSEWGVCTYACFQNGFVDVKRKKAHVHFVHGSLVDYDIFMSIKRNRRFQKKHAISMGTANMI